MLICIPKYGGCGYIGNNFEWKRITQNSIIEKHEIDDMIICPKCLDDHVCQLTDNNFDSLTENESEEYKKKARLKLNNENIQMITSFKKYF
jgi:hypothetical protein